MRERSLRRVLVLAGMPIVGLILGSIAVPAQAGTITYVTPPGSTVTGGAVNAEADFTTSAGSLSVTLKDLLANPTDIGQLLSDLSFTVGNGSLSGATLSSSSGQEVTVASNGTFTLGSTGSTGWAFSTIGTDTGTLDVLGAAVGPAHLIIGPPGGGGYTNANSSIAGNGPHNPFLNQVATFTITAPSVTANSTITSATFSFGTTPGVIVAGVTVAGVPEPASLVMMATGLGSVGLVLLRMRKRRQAA